MSSDAARPPVRPALIRLPDQLQQAKGLDPVQPAEPVGTAEPRDEGGEPAPRREGVLGQLETERAHD